MLGVFCGLGGGPRGGGGSEKENMKGRREGKGGGRERGERERREERRKGRDERGKREREGKGEMRGKGRGEKEREKERERTQIDTSHYQCGQQWLVCMYSITLPHKFQDHWRPRLNTDHLYRPTTSYST